MRAAAPDWPPPVHGPGGDQPPAGLQSGGPENSPGRATSHLLRPRAQRCRLLPQLVSSQQSQGANIRT